ncbi:MAG: hypothetical protein HS122_08305 [Opitutaceae bacterium]|nr:hypothetical protein [Opitutaceae bacterium]
MKSIVFSKVEINLSRYKLILPVFRLMRLGSRVSQVSAQLDPNGAVARQAGAFVSGLALDPKGNRISSNYRDETECRTEV